MKFFYLVLVMALFGCGKSPLLNHVDAKDIEQNISTTLNKQNSNCALHFTEHKLCADISWVKFPKDEEKGEFLIYFWNEGSAKPELFKSPCVQPQATVASKLWMASMGHGSSPVVVTPFMEKNGAVVPGVYRAVDVYFIMPGDWEIWIQLKKEKDILEQKKIDLSVEK